VITPKIHFRVERVITVCGVHLQEPDFVGTENFSQVTCGNCLRKHLVFKCSPENPARKKVIDNVEPVRFPL
jgi:hypothetical protein